MTKPVLLSGSAPADQRTAARMLREGGVVVLPTDTVYGLSASVFQTSAVERIFQLKRRTPEARVPVLLATAADLSILVRDVPRTAWQLIDRFWPGPLTLVLPASSSAPRIITQGGDTIAVRVPAARSCLSVLQVLGEPVVGTSANVSGSPPALTGADALAQLPDVDAVLVDDGAIQAGLSSTVVGVDEDRLVIYRLGAVSAEALRQAAGARIQVEMG